MNNYLVKLCYQGEITEWNTEAKSHYTALLKCLAPAARKYGVSKRSMIRYFTAERLNHEVKLENE